jgi:hypothetical protein
MAPQGNQFWKNRSKHGRNRLFSSPKLLWAAACEYFQWCVDNPLMEVEQAKSSQKVYKDDTGKMVVPPAIIELPKMRPFTLIGLCHYLGCNSAWIRGFKSDLKENEDDKAFLDVITRIEETIYEQKFAGAAAGFFNASIMGRDLGLKEKSETEINGNAGFSFTLVEKPCNPLNDPIID